MKVSITKRKFIITIFSLLAIFLLFYLIYLKVDNEIIFPNPITSINTFLELLKQKHTYSILGYTFLRLLIALLFSFLIGAILGVLAGYNRFIATFLKPWMILCRSTPLASVVVLIMIILGMDKSPYLITMLMIVPVIYEAFYQGILNLDKELMQVWRLDTKFNFNILRKVMIPMASPFIKTAFTQSVGLGVKVLVMAEFICYTPNSIGKSLGQAANNLEYSTVFAWTILAIAFVLIVEQIPYLLSKK